MSVGIAPSPELGIESGQTRGHPDFTPLEVGGPVIVDVARNLEALRPEQYVMAFVFLGSYAFALGQLFEQRGRRVCAGLSFVSALAFIVCCDPWEQGVMLVALALVGIGLFSATAGLVWTVAPWRGMRLGGSEEGRVGKEGRSRWWAGRLKKKKHK